MNDSEFRDIVGRMRAKQKEYFRTRDVTVLKECKDLERRADEALLPPKIKTPDLFGEGQNE